MKKGQLRQQKILNYINDKLRCDGYPPSMREICNEVGLKSASTVYVHLKELEKMGLIKGCEGKKRALRIGNAGGSYNVPILGRVTAGLPILAVESIEGYIPYGGPSSNHKDLFALKVDGESMKNAGILDNDIVIVEKTGVAHNGDIVVALIDDEATVKRFYKEDGHFRLQPENPRFKPIIVNELSILGKVISSIRYY